MGIEISQIGRLNWVETFRGFIAVIFLFACLAVNKPAETVCDFYSGPITNSATFSFMRVQRDGK